ncbi:hypothetical protein U1Q18_013051, partial [Sarracenia purpurea var. burkii]
MVFIWSEIVPWFEIVSTLNTLLFPLIWYEIVCLKPCPAGVPGMKMHPASAHGLILALILALLL